MLSRPAEYPQRLQEISAGFELERMRRGGNCPRCLGIFPMPAVLVVDDEALIRWSVAESLEAAGFRVLEAGSAREALEHFGSGNRSSCVVLLDLRLPDSDDLGLLRRIHEIAPACRIILMTAHGTPEILAEALLAGAYGVLGKPFDMTRVVGMVRDAAAA
jgi:DNA-binding NtrC family response regulator